MPQVRCPQCGATNDTRAPDYPFCIGCQDNLAKCGYCRWFDDTGVLCTHPIVSGVFEVSATATPPCVYHTPNQRVTVRRIGVQALAWVAVAATVFGLGFLVARLLWPRTPSSAQPRLELAVEADYGGAAIGKPYTVTAVVYNTSDVTAEDVRVEISEQSLAQFHLRSVRPEPVRQGKYGQWWMLSYDSLVPHERRRVTLELEPKATGVLHVTVRLVSGEHVYHGMADLPVVVAQGETGVDPSREVEEEP